MNSPATTPPAYDPAPGTEYRYPISDYARETARVLGHGWGAESGYYGAYGSIWGPTGETVLLFVDTDRDFGGLMLAVEKGKAEPDLYMVDLPDGAPTDADDLRTTAEIIAAEIRKAHRP
ncbi:hypothetical protein ABZ352_18855 [Streptomyces griseofuscus]|uniref:hypothetical protein n=1 Tax=Streptomyces griseofuscus TaxID=146922 RepID=UPI00340B980C